jgi:AraC-like DNA-binding protein
MDQLNVIDLIDRLASAHTHATIMAVREYRLKAVTCDMPLLVIPLAGIKRLRVGERSMECARGAFLMVHSARAFDVENIPDGDVPYRALTVSFDWRVVDIARKLIAAHPRPASVGSDEISLGPLAGISLALQEYLEADPGNPHALDYRALGLLLALGRSGHDGFLTAGDPSTAARVRNLIAAAPAKDWKAGEIEEILCVSSATLRRRLQEEGTSFRALLLDARLLHGLMLLQTTARRPVKTIALACGYRSVPSFSRAFAERYGVEPAQVACN